jgi:hypothetical protein
VAIFMLLHVDQRMNGRVVACGAMKPRSRLTPGPYPFELTKYATIHCSNTTGKRSGLPAAPLLGF